MALCFSSNCSLSHTAQIALTASQCEHRAAYSSHPSCESLRLTIIPMRQVSQEPTCVEKGEGKQEHSAGECLNALQVTAGAKELRYPWFGF